MIDDDHVRAHADLRERVRAAIPTDVYRLDRLDVIGAGRLSFGTSNGLPASAARAIRVRTALIHAGLHAAVEHRTTVRVGLAPEMLAGLAVR